MDQTTAYNFRKVTVEDFALLNTWQSNPHVAEWWGNDDPSQDEEYFDPRVTRTIVSYRSHPFAFMQDYDVNGWDDHHFAGLPEGSRGIDQYIGDPHMIGIGHGSAFIGQRMKALFDNGAPVIATDPHPENKRAIAVYEKLGFKQSGPSQETQGGMILPMLARR